MACHFFNLVHSRLALSTYYIIRSNNLVSVGVTRVFEGNFGYLHMGKDITIVDGRTIHFSQYGCSYEEWKAGVEPTPMEELYCPHIYRNRFEPFFRCCNEVPEECKFYSDKAKCWKEWHERYKKN